MEIDLNSDLGEGAGQDAEILTLVTSANVSCGVHAGSVMDIRAALEGAKAGGVIVGAHPGYPGDFGRTERDLDENAVRNLVLDQLAALRSIAADVGVPIRYLKPHGALYNQACRDDRYARPILAAAREAGLPLLALPDSKLDTGAGFFREGFADRRYLPDGSLVPRSRPDAFVSDPDEAVEQALALVRRQYVRSLCVHGDHPEAVTFVRRLRDALTRRGIAIRPFA
jgi:5-oxoprolinase (ATP-hydrolysing) subunit A